MCLQEGWGCDAAKLRQPFVVIKGENVRWEDLKKDLATDSLCSWQRRSSSGTRCHLSTVGKFHTGFKAGTSSQVSLVRCEGLGVKSEKYGRTARWPKILHLQKNINAIISLEIIVYCFQLLFIICSFVLNTSFPPEKTKTKLESFISKDILFCSVLNSWVPIMASWNVDIFMTETNKKKYNNHNK